MPSILRVLTDKQTIECVDCGFVVFIYYSLVTFFYEDVLFAELQLMIRNGIIHLI